jgi:phosphopantetheine adenylyltransferase
VEVEVEVDQQVEVLVTQVAAEEELLVVQVEEEAAQVDHQVAQHQVVQVVVHQELVVDIHQHQLTLLVMDIKHIVDHQVEEVVVVT